jgi:hypothetical protein
MQAETYTRLGHRMPQRVNMVAQKLSTFLLSKPHKHITIFFYKIFLQNFFTIFL